MNRRQFIASCGMLSIVAPGISGKSNPSQKVITVLGPVNISQLGTTLSHEHILVDFIGADNYDPNRWSRNVVIEAVLPYLQELKQLGVNTIFEFTPAYLGRDPILLQRLSTKSGINLVTNTGYYGAVDNKYLPEDAVDLSENELAGIWTGEFERGIDGTGIKPGFIKISVNPGQLSDLHKKLVRAAATTHLNTGLTIASHTGPALPAFGQLEIISAMGVHPSAFIWVHAQNEKDTTHYREVAGMGAWVSLDGIQKDNVDHYIESLTVLKQNKLLHRVLISHDAGWYEPGKPWQGPKRKYTDIIQYLVPKLKNSGFTDKDITQLLAINPGKAFAIGVRKQ